MPMYGSSCLRYADELRDPTAYQSSRTRGRFFFFQAEDGIRDLTVTGVQTCALPISDARLVAALGRAGALSGPASTRCYSQRTCPQTSFLRSLGCDRRGANDVAAGEIGRASCRERV